MCNTRPLTLKPPTLLFHWKSLGIVYHPGNPCQLVVCLFFICVSQGTHRARQGKILFLKIRQCPRVSERGLARRGSVLSLRMARALRFAGVQNRTAGGAGRGDRAVPSQRGL